MKVKIVLAVIFAVILSGCVGTPDAEGWGYGQKRDFLNILKEDRYASLCNQQALYEKVKATESSKLLSKLLVAYTKNLANGCIDLASFQAIQRQRKSKDIDTHYQAYTQVVKRATILRQLKAGQTIAMILAPYVPKSKQFDKLIQAYNHLKDDVSQSTVAKRIRLNIERVKLMNPKLGENYTLINVPEFMLRIVENEIVALKFRVVVGKKHMQTPIFAAPLQYITLNPQWSVPDSIARKEIIPARLKNSNYLKRKDMVIRTSYDLNSKKIDFDSIDWTPYLEDKEGKLKIPYKFIQRASVRNGLGRVKFIFPNSHAVYMHDTLAKSLFKRDYRAYSHGCIRLQRPVSLLEHLSTHYTDHQMVDVKKKYDSLKTHYVKLNKEMMVHTAYFTTYVDESGMLHVFNDIYGFDKLQRLNF